jgi:trk system potassium uptake protein TrkH
MLFPAVVSLAYGERREAVAFFSCCLPMIAIGLAAARFIDVPKDNALRMRDGFFIVGSSWLLMSLAGALPFIITGSIPNVFDAYFETASGFTTTGATILRDVEALPNGILFWRSFTHWLGGMGILLLTIALLPMLGIGGQKIMRAETTGPTMDKITFTINDTAKGLYKIYVGMTVLQIVLLFAGGLSLFDAAVHTFGSVGTGGFSIYNRSIGYYDNFYVDMVITIFMLAAGVNFSLYFKLFTGEASQFFHDFELRMYVRIVAASTVFIAGMLFLKGYYADIVQSFRHAFFQVASIITTTGYATTDFNMWPAACKMVLFALMVTGPCASSTGGGIKVIRAALIAKLIQRGIYRRTHPDAVFPIRAGGRTVPADVMSGVVGFVLVFIVVSTAAFLFLCLEDVDGVTAASSVIACISNIGPGFEAVGPVGNFAFYSNASKFMLSILMITGRLELYTVLLLFMPMFWNRNR